ncbi:tRNA uridine(34) 5-carboxymethylaminomethyl modification radical SAM/GNAT enzyme Elp3 [Candidatus Woesearchaeota archaeon]|nr:tRNA uridine(34) 5-carboxymethylaminomethyl modification radical SAM/GNAT enzyme Elp3 [Candidatus Woesearchaeota archaeon]
MAGAQAAREREQEKERGRQDAFYRELIAAVKASPRLGKDGLSKIKYRLCGKHGIGRPPTDIAILLHADEADVPALARRLKTKPGRGISGVSVVAVMTRPRACPHGRCRMCPGGIRSAFGTVPQSYTGREPATMRGIRNRYDAYLQVFNRLEQYVVMGHVPEKAELIVMGGTFPSFPKRYRERFVADAFAAMNDFSRLFFREGNLDLPRFKRFFLLPGKVGDPARDREVRRRMLAGKRKRERVLEKEQARNETAAVRCVGLTIETRPDYGMRRHGLAMLRLGATRVEVGVQSTDDDALARIGRGHTVADSIQSMRELRDLGFKLNVHYMLGLPGMTRKKDVEGMHRLFDDPDFRPDMLKIYPCMVMRGTPLHRDWRQGRFRPIGTKEAVERIIAAKRRVPPYCRIMRVQRDIPTAVTEAGVGMTNLRQLVHAEMRRRGERCRCIRCREVGRAPAGGGKGVSYGTIEYLAAQGHERFIFAGRRTAGEWRLLGFARLRFPSDDPDAAFLRELHVYGSATPLGERGEVQHTGIGRELMRRAETQATAAGRSRLLVISGIGVRGYYRRLGYRRGGPERLYMEKRLGTGHRG